MAVADLASLYRPWWDALRAVPDGSAGADPLALFRRALEGSATAAPQCFETLLSVLQQGGLTPLTAGLQAMAALGQDNLKRIGEAWNGGDRSAWLALFSAPAGLSPNALVVGAERTFGAFAEALGMRPMRELQDALQQLAGADSERRSALAAYLGVVVQAFGQGSQQLLARLSVMAGRGEEVTSLTAFVRLWAGEVDGALQTALQSEAGLAATAQAMRASLKRRAELQRLVALASAALNIPTRAEVDDAFREIQQLKREVRRLKKGPSPQPGNDAEATVGTRGLYADTSAGPPSGSSLQAPAKPATRKAARKRTGSPGGTARARQTGDSK